MRAALLRTSTGKIENVITIPDDYDPSDEDGYKPNEGQTVKEDPDNKAFVGGFFRNNAWESPPVVAPTELVATVQEQFDTLISILRTKNTITAAEVVNIRKPPPRT